MTGFDSGDAGREWTPPEELGAARMRAVRLTGGGRAVLILAVAMVIGGIAGAVGLAAAARRGDEARRVLREAGVTTDATVTRLTRTSGKNQHWYVEYRFTAEGGEHGDREQVSRKVWNSLREGATLPVRYVPGDPSNNHPVGWEDNGAPFALVFIIPGVFGLVAWLLVWMVRRQIRLLTEGRPAPAVVTELKKADKGQVVQKYEFLLLSGATAKGRTQTNKPLPVGSRLTVIYDPDNPKRNAPYPFSLVRPANARADRAGSQGR